MLDIYIINNYNIESEAVKELCIKYSIIRNYDISVHVTEKPKQDNRTVIYFISFDDNTTKIARVIRSSSVSYILLILNDSSQLFKAVNPMTSVSGFLLRPVMEKELFEMLDCVFKDYDSDVDYEHLFKFKLKSRIYTIPYKKILFFEASNKKVKIRTAAQEIDCLLCLGEIENHVPEYFVRTHKSYIVNIKHTSKVDFGKMIIELDDGSSIGISRTYKGQLKERLEKGNDSVPL